MMTLKKFYHLIFYLRDIKRSMVESYLKDPSSVTQEKITPLQNTLKRLQSTISKNQNSILKLNTHKTIFLNLSYEINELQKDIFFLENGEKAFLSFMSFWHPHFNRKVNRLTKELQKKKFSVFITDRDGTINNYCGRYASSVQSVYNAVFLARFARKMQHAIILTSAPLSNIGLTDITITPKKYFILAASKGREYINQTGKRHQFPIAKEKQKALLRLNAQLTDLMKSPRYKKFSMIGSGLQFKFGQTTIARQDVSGSISKTESQTFLKFIINLVARLDKNKEIFRIEDTGKDIEIILTIEDTAKNRSQSLKDFDKGNGIHFLNKNALLHLENKNILACGDTLSDIPIFNACNSYSKKTTTVFVLNENTYLKQKIRRLCKKTLFVDNPDILVAALNNLSSLQ